jgi:hypothetical protein
VPHLLIPIQCSRTTCESVPKSLDDRAPICPYLKETSERVIYCDLFPDPHPGNSLGKTKLYLHQATDHVLRCKQCLDAELVGSLNDLLEKHPDVVDRLLRLLPTGRKGDTLKDPPTWYKQLLEEDKF